MTILAAGAECTTAVVRERQTDGRYVILTFESDSIAHASAPGRFVTIEQRAPGHLLRRPFSIFDADPEQATFQIGFDIAGDGTQWLADQLAGTQLSVTGPLGKAFMAAPPGAKAVLVGGGYGAAPVIYLSRLLREAGVDTHIVLGAASADRLFCLARARESADKVTVTTDDGSMGMRGRVTAAMEGLDDLDVVYACGPMPMLAAVTRAAPPKAAVEVAVEEFMGCGIGICWTCVVPTAEDGYRRHIRSCIEGPVLDGRTIAWT